MTRIAAYLLGVAIVASAFTALADGGAAPPELEITFAGTALYDAQVKKLAVSLQEAEKIADKFLGKLPAPHGVGRHCVLIGGKDYVFSFPPKKLGLALTGTYVDGSTGIAREVTAEDVQRRFGKQFPNNFIPTAEMRLLGYKSPYDE